MKKLAEAIKLASDIREKSFNKKAFQDAIQPDTIVDAEDYYGKSLAESSQEAAGIVGYTLREFYPIYLLLKLAWNDSLDWSEQVLEKGEEHGDLEK